MPQAEGEHIRFDVTITPGISAIVKIESLFRWRAARRRRQRASIYALTLTTALDVSDTVK